MKTLSLNQLFPSRATKAPEQALMPQPQNPNNRQEGETYHHWGLRVCAIADGGSYTLTPYLHNVYNYNYHEQIHNEALQNQQRKNIECEIEQKHNNIANLDQQLAKCIQSQAEEKDKIDELIAERQKWVDAGYQINKKAQIKLRIGLMILLPLTFYLFLFYSSSFCSAFLMSPDEVEDIASAMFNPQAFSYAWDKSIVIFFLMLTFPVVFLGLGYTLHSLSTQERWNKYIKMSAILMVTFIFDCILAYQIGEILYPHLNPPYSPYIAIIDVHTWAVIFGGFIAYLIWGSVFGNVMDAYDKLDLNKIKIKTINDKIKNIESTIADKKIKEQKLNNQISQAKNDISSLTAKMKDKYIIDLVSIRMEMTEFFTGWLSGMHVLGKDDTQQRIANDTFERVINDVMSQNKS